METEHVSWALLYTFQRSSRELWTSQGTNSIHQQPVHCSAPLCSRRVDRCC